MNACAGFSRGGTIGFWPFGSAAGQATKDDGLPHNCGSASKTVLSGVPHCAGSSWGQTIVFGLLVCALAGHKNRWPAPQLRPNQQIGAFGGAALYRFFVGRTIGLLSAPWQATKDCG
jgi:hypothetical protein